MGGKGSDENIEVDVHQLQDFAQKIQDELTKNFQPTFQNGIAPALQGIQPPFGGGGLAEGRLFRTEHDKSRAAAQALLAEAMKGLGSLAAAAKSIAMEYLDGDASAQELNDDVYKAFDATTPPPTTDNGGKDGDGKGDGTVPVSEQHKDPHNYSTVTGGGDNQTPSMYQEHSVGKGDDKLTIQGDDEDMHNPDLKMPKIEN